MKLLALRLLSLRLAVAKLDAVYLSAAATAAGTEVSSGLAVRLGYPTLKSRQVRCV